MVFPGFVTPGQLVVGRSDPHFAEYVVGSGLEIGDRGITATILGKLQATEQTSTKASKWILSISNEFKNPYAQIPSTPSGNSKRSTSQLPQVGDIVYARVLRLQLQQVYLDIIAVENKGLAVTDSGVGIFASAVGSVHPSSGHGEKVSELGEGYGAIIRVQDIRATERDRIKLAEQFVPGDLVRASVLSIGDENHYYLSTIQNDLGVIFAKNPDTGVQLLPLDWQRMIDPSNGISYARKCANPFV